MKPPVILKKKERNVSPLNPWSGNPFDKWMASRGNVNGYGKTKVRAIADLEETERFLEIAGIAQQTLAS